MWGVVHIQYLQIVHMLQKLLYYHHTIFCTVFTLQIKKGCRAAVFICYVLQVKKS
jgi:hypothetical protein